MMETLTAAAIATLAFEGAIKAGAGKLTEEAIKQAKLLWQKIGDKFKGNPIAEEALRDAAEQKSPEILETEVVPLLQVAMRKDLQFAQEIQNIAQQINQEIIEGSQDTISIKATAHDNSTVKQVGKIEAKRVQF